MAREEFIDNLRRASRLLVPPTVSSGQGSEVDNYLGSVLHSTDLWLTPKFVEGFVSTDFGDMSEQDRRELEKEVAAFTEIAKQVQNSATKAQTREARKHLEQVIKIVGRKLLHDWLEAQNEMVAEATAAAKANGWYVEQDDKDVHESLLGQYKAPRLRIRTQEKEVVLDPIACFGSGRQGVVDLVVMPSYETAYLVAFKNGSWQIISPQGKLHSRPFSQTTLVNTIARLPR